MDLPALCARIGVPSTQGKLWALQIAANYISNPSDRRRRLVAPRSAAALAFLALAKRRHPGGPTMPLLLDVARKVARGLPTDALLVRRCRASATWWALEPAGYEPAPDEGAVAVAPLLADAAGLLGFDPALALAANS